jgi:single-stranded-DNA-specific exonuclease
MNAVGQRILGNEELIPEINIDAILSLEEVTLATLREIQRLEPFGQGNPLPVFMTPGVAIHDLQYMGRERQHARFKATPNGKRDFQLEVVAFNMQETFRRMETRGALFDLAYELHLNVWNGQEKLQLRLIDLRVHQA